MEENTPAPGKKLHPVATRRASEAIYEQIQALILSGELKPGDRLPSERSLMDQLQRSRPTIREALRMLEHAGLIRTMPGTNGAVVCAPGTDGLEESLMAMLCTQSVTVRELAEYRLENETAVARWAAARRTEEDLARLSGILDRAAETLENGAYAAFLGHDADFHRELARAGGNTVASIMAELLSRMAAPKLLEAAARQTEAENAAMCSRILDTHREILFAVEAMDALGAETAMARHIGAFGEDLGREE